MSASTATRTGEQPDPRPLLVRADVAVELLGATCPSCSYVVAGESPRCPACGTRTEPARFAGNGRVWSATTVHVSVQGRQIPYTLAYVDLDDGPRVLVHLPSRPPVGARVRLVGTTASGDLQAAVVDAGGAR